MPKVLIVDDIPANLLALEAVLSELACTVVSARSGDDALGLLLQERFAVMLLDVQMPSMDGYEVARHVRMHSETRDLPIIFLTAGSSNTDENLRLGYDCGAADFLFKPINRAALCSKVKVFVELSANRHELAEANARLERTNFKLLALVDAEATSASALRQAHDDLGLAYRDLRGAQGQLVQTSTLSKPNGFTHSEPPSAVRDPLGSAIQKLEAARASLAWLGDPRLLTLSEEAETEWQKARSLLDEATLQLLRLAELDGHAATSPDVNEANQGPRWTSRVRSSSPAPGVQGTRPTDTK